MKFLRSKRSKVILRISIAAVVVLVVGSLTYLVASGKISADILSSNSVTADASQGQAFSSSVDAAIATNALKISAIPVNAGFKFDHWDTSSSSCTFLDKTKAITIAATNGSCQMTAKFSVVAMTTDTTGYTPIATVTDLDKVRSNLSGKYIQTADIDLSGQNFAPIGNFSNPAAVKGYFQYFENDSGVFSGEYNGNGKVIKNLTIDKTEANIGFIRANKGTIKNLTFQNTQVKGGEFGISVVAAINMPSGIIDNVGVSGNLEGRDQGGAVARYWGAISAVNLGKIQNSSANIAIAGSGKDPRYVDVGGIVGGNLSGVIDNCYSLGTINNVFMRVGGIAGWNDSGANSRMVYNPARIYNSSSNMSITGSIDPSGAQRSYGLGGLVGESDGYMGKDGWGVPVKVTAEIKNSFATGDISGEWRIGGLIGSAQYDNHIDNSYTNGNILKVSSRAAGGLIGDVTTHPDLQNTKITNSKANTKIEMLGKGQSIGGFIGFDWADIEVDNCDAVSTIAPAAGITLDSDIYNAHLGGFFGSVNPTKIGIKVSRSSSVVNLLAPDGANAVGGFIGGSSSTGFKFYDSYAKGTIKFAKSSTGVNIAGFAGVLSSSGISTGPMVTTVITDPHGNTQDPNTADLALVNCFSNVAIVNSQKGAGFMTMQTWSDIKLAVVNSYFNKSLPGTLSKPSYGDAKTDKEMKAKATFTGWDFDNIWSRLDGKSYPTLRKVSATVTLGKSVNATNPQLITFDTSISDTNTTYATTNYTTWWNCTGTLPEQDVVTYDSLKAVCGDTAYRTSDQTALTNPTLETNGRRITNLYVSPATGTKNRQLANLLHGKWTYSTSGTKTAVVLVERDGRTPVYQTLTFDVGASRATTPTRR